MPAFYGSDSGDEVLLPVAVSSSGSAARKRNPVILINGGPGSSMFESSWPEHDPMTGLFDTIAPLVRDRDVILFDQRGVGLSVPNMNCPEIDRLAEEARRPIGANAQEEWQKEFDALEACAHRLRSESVDPAMLSTSATARDIVTILDDLGREKTEVWAISYGTSVALALVRDHGERVGRVLLDGVLPTHADYANTWLASSVQTFDRLFQACRDDPVCAGAFPGLEERFKAQIERLNSRPREMVLWSDRWHSVMSLGQPTVKVDGDAVIRGLFYSLYETEFIPYLPFILSVAVDMNVTLLTMCLEFSHYGDSGLYEGVHETLWCREEFPFLDNEKFLTEAERHGIYGRAWRHYGAPGWCEPWDVPPASPEERLPVESDHVVLLVSGWFDPVTPDLYAEAVAAHLPNSRHLVFRSAGHVPTASEPRATELAARFFASARPLDVDSSSCHTLASAPVFALEAPE